MTAGIDARLCKRLAAAIAFLYELTGVTPDMRALIVFANPEPDSFNGRLRSDVAIHNAFSRVPDPHQPGSGSRAAS